MQIEEHPNYGKIENRVRNLFSHALPVSCSAYRMTKPRYHRTRDIVSGLGGFGSNGRWCLKNHFHCSYLSYSPETALEEVLAASRRKNLPDTKALPRVLVCVGVRLQRVLHLTDGQLRQHCRVSQKLMLEEQWWRRNYLGHEATTQALGRAVASAGFEGIVVPSAADRPHGVNLVVFTGNLLSGSSLDVDTPIRWR